MSDNDERVYHPGGLVPASGMYECECAQRHRYSADVRGHRFPPLQEGRTGTGWKLVISAHDS